MDQSGVRQLYPMRLISKFTPLYSASRKSETAQLSIKATTARVYRFAFAAYFNLKRRIGAIGRPNMGNVINLMVRGRAARLRAAVRCAAVLGFN